MNCQPPFALGFLVLFKCIFLISWVKLMPFAKIQLLKTTAPKQYLIVVKWKAQRTCWWLTSAQLRSFWHVKNHLELPIVLCETWQPSWLIQQSHAQTSNHCVSQPVAQPGRKQLMQHNQVLYTVKAYKRSIRCLFAQPQELYSHLQNWKSYKHSSLTESRQKFSLPFSVWSPRDIVHACMLGEH